MNLDPGPVWWEPPSAGPGPIQPPPGKARLWFHLIYFFFKPRNKRLGTKIPTACTHHPATGRDLSPARALCWFPGLFHLLSKSTLVLCFLTDSFLRESMVLCLSSILRFHWGSVSVCLKDNVRLRMVSTLYIHIYINKISHLNIQQFCFCSWWCSSNKSK